MATRSETRSDRRFPGDRLLLFFWICIPVVLYCIPMQGMLEGETLCIFTRLTGHHCWGCGMTRAFFSLLHLHFRAAWEFNPLIVAVAPLLIYLYVQELLRIVRRLRHRGGTSSQESGNGQL